MKSSKLFLSAMLIALAGTVATSCSSDEDAIGSKRAKLQVTTEIASATATRAVVTGTSFKNGDVIGVSVYDEAGTTPYNSASSNLDVTLNSGTWTFSNPVELTGNKATVFGYYPYNAAVTGLSVPVDLSTDNDYMYATCAEKVNADAPSANLVFHHALARLSFTISRSANSMYNFNVKGAEISNYEGSTLIATTGTMNMATGVIAPNSVANAKVGKVTNATLDSKTTSTTIDMLVLPCNMGSTGHVKLELEIDNAKFAVELKGENWEAGKWYKYDGVTVTTTANSDDFADNSVALDVSNLSVTIVDWVAGTPVTEIGSLENNSTDAEPVQAIDLGLPSGNKWANRNMGAYKPTDNGALFSWGECKPKSSYTLADYVYQKSGNYTNIGTDISGTIYDVAHKAWGDGWCIPTKADWEELMTNCNCDLETIDGTLCMKIVSKADATKNIILPCGGYSDGVSLKSENDRGCYWTSTTYNNTNAYYFRNYGKYVASPNIENFAKYAGLSIRAVKK